MWAESTAGEYFCDKNMTISATASSNISILFIILVVMP